MVWCGLRNGLMLISEAYRSILPATECILVVSCTSRRFSGGNMDGSLLASMVSPATGGTIKITL